MGGMKEHYPDGAGHRGVETSIHAAEIVDSNRLRGMILDMLRNYSGGLTSLEISENLRIPFYSVQPRLSELKAKGLVYDSGERREGRTKCNMIVWYSTPLDQIKPPAVKLKPVGNPDLFAKMIQASIAYSKLPDRINHNDMIQASKKWVEALAGSMGNITYTIEGEK